jgi:hypothetical protein
MSTNIFVLRVESLEIFPPIGVGGDRREGRSRKVREEKRKVRHGIFAKKGWQRDCRYQPQGLLRNYGSVARRLPPNVPPV